FRPGLLRAQSTRAQGANSREKPTHAPFAFSLRDLTPWRSAMPTPDGLAERSSAQDLAGRIEAGGPHDAAARVSGRAAQVQAADRGRVACVAGNRTEREELAGGHRALEDVSAGEVEDALEVGRCQHLAVYDGALEVRRVLVHHVEAAIGEYVALLIPGAVAELVRRVLDEHRHQVLPGRP